MASDQDLQAFVRQHLRSVWALELLLLLRRDPQRAWSPEDLVRELRGSDALVAVILEDFERSGLVAPDAGGLRRYAPANPVLDELSGHLEAAYRERPVAIVNMIAQRPDPLQGLADAFKFRGEGK